MYLNHIQLKTARNVLNLGVRDVGLLIQTSRTTISKLENNIISICNMRLADRRNVILQEFFRKKGIVFPSKNLIIFCSKRENISQRNNSISNLTRFQLRAARIISNKTQEELARLARIHPSVIMYAENLPNEAYINPKNTEVISILIDIFQQYEITFPDIFSISFKN